MNPQHLSDEAVAAFADGVLGGSARERATRHIDTCAECRQAVKVQREAAFALRAAPAPALPTALFERLRTVPQTTELPAVPATVDRDGTPMLSTFAPLAAFVPNRTARRTQPPARGAAEVERSATAAAPRTAGPPHTSGHRIRPFVTTAAIVALAGSLAAGSVARPDEPAQTGVGQINQTTHDRGSQPVVDPVSFFRGAQP
jgi:hypothetical protein